MKIYKLLLILLFILPSVCYAHSGRLDSKGGHRVNKPHTYDDKYIEIVNGGIYYKDGELKFRKGDYHYHVHPGKTSRADGIYIPVREKATGEVTTDDVVISQCTVVASKESDVYHNPDSGYTRKMKEENVVIFNNSEEAEKEGYRPSKFFKECQK